MRKTIIYIVVNCALIALMLFAFIGCKTQQPPIVPTIEEGYKETTVPRDTIIVTEADSASIKALVRCDSLNNALLDELSQQDGKRIDSGVNIKKNEDGSLLLEFNCKEDSLEHEIQLRDKIIENYRKEKEIVQVEVVPPYYKRVNTGFWILLAILVVIVGWKVAKIYFKIQSGGIL